MAACTTTTNFPLNHVIEIDISEAEGTGGPALCFTVVKTQAGAIGGGDDWWIGVPYAEDLVTTRDLFNYVKQNNPDDTINVTEGNDPRRVKREPGDREAAGDEPLLNYSIKGTIDLTSGDEDAPADPALPIAAASKSAFRKVQRCVCVSNSRTSSCAPRELDRCAPMLMDNARAHRSRYRSPSHHQAPQSWPTRLHPPNYLLPQHVQAPRRLPATPPPTRRPNPHLPPQTRLLARHPVSKRQPQPVP